MAAALQAYVRPEDAVRRYIALSMHGNTAHRTALSDQVFAGASSIVRGSVYDLIRQRHIIRVSGGGRWDPIGFVRLAGKGSG